MKNLKKILAFVLVIALTAAATVGITLAFLTDETDTKHNVFTVGNVDVTLEEEVGVNTDNDGLTTTPTGAEYNLVVPGDELTKKVTAGNVGSIPAYMAVTVTVNNADDILAVGKYFADKGYSDAEIQAIYTEIFDGWGVNYATTDMPLAVTTKPAYTLQVDSVLTGTGTVAAYNNNWYADNAALFAPYDGYYSEGMANNEIKYTYYLYLEPGKETVLFNGLRVPEYFNSELMAMFSQLEIDISGAAIQADNFGTLGADASAKAAFTALHNEQNPVITVENAADLSSAISEAGSEPVTLDLAAGTYKLPSDRTSAKDITITGDTNTVIDLTWGAYQDNTKMTFEGVTIKGSTGYVTSNGTSFGSDYAALYTPNVTYKNCTFDGPFRIGRDGATFVNCKFTNLGNDYVWTYGNDATFIGCTFESEGKALLIYSDGGNEVSKVTVKNCIFNATKSGYAGAISNQPCAAIEIENRGNGVNLVTEGNTVDSDFSGLWRIKTYHAGKPDVIVNGTTYTSLSLDGKLMTITGTEVTVQ